MSKHFKISTFYHSISEICPLHFLKSLTFGNIQKLMCQRVYILNFNLLFCSIPESEIYYIYLRCRTKQEVEIEVGYISQIRT